MTTALEIPSHARARQSDSCAGHDPHCRSALPCIFVNALRRLNGLCMYKRRLSASKPAAEPQIAAASHSWGRALPGTHYYYLPTHHNHTHPLLCSLARRQLRICQVVAACPPSSNGDSNISSNQSGDPAILAPRDRLVKHAI